MVPGCHAQQDGGAIGQDPPPVSQSEHPSSPSRCRPRHSPATPGSRSEDPRIAGAPRAVKLGQSVGVVRRCHKTTMRRRLSENIGPSDDPVDAGWMIDRTRRGWTIVGSGAPARGGHLCGRPAPPAGHRRGLRSPRPGTPSFRGTATSISSGGSFCGGVSLRNDQQTVPVDNSNGWSASGQRVVSERVGKGRVMPRACAAWRPA